MPNSSEDGTKEKKKPNYPSFSIQNMTPFYMATKANLLPPYTRSITRIQAEKSELQTMPKFFVFNYFQHVWHNLLQSKNSELSEKRGVGEFSAVLGAFGRGF